MTNSPHNKIDSYWSRHAREIFWYAGAIAILSNAISLAPIAVSAELLPGNKSRMPRLPDPALEEKNVVAAKELFEVLQKVDWATAKEASTKKRILKVIKPFGWSLASFELGRRPTDMSILSNIDLARPTCLTPQTWTKALGLPRAIVDRGEHTNPEVIQRALSGPYSQTNWIEIVYSLGTDLKYSLSIINEDQCFESIVVTRNQ